MNIQDFHSRFSRDTLTPAEQVCDHWEKEKQVDDFLGTEVFAGAVVADLLTGDGMLDQISTQLREGFSQLMGSKADSYNEIRQILLDKISGGDASVLGLVNKIKGQLGENQFLRECAHNGIHAHLAELGNQEAWDVAVDKGNGVTQYVQVKMYSDPGRVVEKIRDVQGKLENGSVMGQAGEAVHTIDFAVPEDIADEVHRRVAEAGLDVNILPIEMSADDAASVVQGGIDNVGPECLEHFFGELLGSALTTTALHAITNGFLVYKGAKDASAFWGDTLRSSSVSLTGLTAGMTAEAILHKVAWLGGFPTFALVFATSFTTRAIAKRLLKRGDLVKWLRAENRNLDVTIYGLNAAT